MDKEKTIETKRGPGRPKKGTPPPKPIKKKPAKKVLCDSKMKYAPNLNNKAYNLTLAGFSIDEIAAAWDLNQNTLREWILKYPLFGEAVTRGREEADGKVARALFKRALGLRVKKQQAVKVRMGMDETIEIVEIYEELPPDTGAATNWLANRQRGKWGKDRKDTADDVSCIGEFLKACGDNSDMADLYIEESQ